MTRKPQMIDLPPEQEQGFILPFNTHTPRSDASATFGNIEWTLPRPDMAQDVPLDRVPTDDAPPAPLWLTVALAIGAVCIIAAIAAAIAGRV